MSYWTGLSEETQKQYSEEFKKPAVVDTPFNPFKIVKCNRKGCDQIVVMRLINDPLSNSSYYVYAGACVNGHWDQAIPGTPFDLKEPPRCPKCNSTMQYKTCKEYNGFVCTQKHVKSEQKEASKNG